MTEANADKAFKPARLIIVMGVAGSGKTTVGTALAGLLGKPFLDADDYHPAGNVEKMSHGIPLTDADRWPWLDRLANALKARAETEGMAISACSALRRAYRNRLISTAGETVLFVFLHGSHEVIARRMAARTDHFMPTGLLSSQFATLEPPTSDENAIYVDVRLSVATLAGIIRDRLAEAAAANSGDTQ